MPRLKHIHKYLRVVWGKKKTIILRCMQPGCSHYVHEEMAEGRKSICWRCGAEFIMNKQAIRLKKPHCPRCTKGYKDTEIPIGDVEMQLDAMLKID